MPRGSEELTLARKEEIINACAELYETRNFKDVTLKGYRGADLLYPHADLLLFSYEGRDFPGPAAEGV